MSLTIETLESEALQLSATERSQLIVQLIASLNMDPAIEDAWAVEVERRNAELECGAVALIPGPEALATLRAGFE